jgi:hypothetical protein
VPLDERGSIPLEFITDVVVPAVDKKHGRRFDLHTLRYGDFPYARDVGASPAVQGQALSGGSSGVQPLSYAGSTSTSPMRKGAAKGSVTATRTRVFSLEAPTIHDRIEWVRHLKLMLGMAQLPAGTLSQTQAATNTTALATPRDATGLPVPAGPQQLPRGSV